MRWLSLVSQGRSELFGGYELWRVEWSNAAKHRDQNERILEKCFAKLQDLGGRSTKDQDSCRGVSYDDRGTEDEQHHLVQQDTGRSPDPFTWTCANRP